MHASTAPTGGEWPSQAPKAGRGGSRGGGGCARTAQSVHLSFICGCEWGLGTPSPAEGASCEASGAGGLTVDGCELEAQLNKSQTILGIRSASSCTDLPNHMPAEVRSSKRTPDSHSVHESVSQHPSPNGPCLSTAWGVCTAATCTVDMTVAAGDDTEPLAAEGAATFASVASSVPLIPMRPS